MKIDYKNFNPNNKNFGNQLLKNFQKIISQNIDIGVKTSWINKNDVFPIITITKGMDEMQKIYETKIISIDFNVWAKDKKSRDLITDNVFSLLKNINFGNDFLVNINKNPLTIEVRLGEDSEDSNTKNEVEISKPQIIDFEEKKGIFRSNFCITMRMYVDVDNKKLQTLKDRENKAKFFDTLVLGKFGGVGGEIKESKDKNVFLFQPTLERNLLALIENNKVIWKIEFGSIHSFDLASDGSYAIAVGSLTKKETRSKYRSGGHIYLIDISGKIKLNFKIPADGLSCSISPNNKFFGVTTMGPEWEVYFFTSNGKLIWHKSFDNKVGGIELTNNKIILYDKMHKETRKKVMRLDTKGNTIKKWNN